MLLELRGDRAFDRPVAAVVHARRDLVDDRPVARGEEFDGQNADMAERLGDPRRPRARLLDLARDGVAGRNGRGAQYAFAVDVVGAVPEGRAAVGPASKDDGEFGGEVDPASATAGSPPIASQAASRVAGERIQAWPLPS